MGFLAAVVAKIGEWLISSLISFVSAVAKKFIRQKQIDSESEASVKPLKDAKTGEEIDKASDSALGGF